MAYPSPHRNLSLTSVRAMREINAALAQRCGAVNVARAVGFEHLSPVGAIAGR